MDSADLKVFEAVARNLSMNKAAAELGTVQSNVTARIRRLEKELDAVLFYRLPSGVRLTRAGERLVPFAIQSGLLLDQAKQTVRKEGEPSGSLTIGSLETTAALRLGDCLTAFVRDYPAVDLALHTGTSAELVGSVCERRIDGAFVCGPVENPALVATKVFEETLVILTSASSGSLKSALSADNIRIVVLRAGCSYRQRLEELLANRGVVGLRLLEFGTLEAIISCVSAGLGITMLPRDLIGPVVRSGRVKCHELPKKQGDVATYFIRRKDIALSEATKRFLEYAHRARLHATEEAD